MNFVFVMITNVTCSHLGSRELVYFAAIVSLALGFMGLFWAFIAAGDIRFILLVMFAVFCGYVYQVQTCHSFQK